MRKEEGLCGRVRTEQDRLPTMKADTRLRHKKVGFRCSRASAASMAILLLAAVLRTGWPTLAEFKFDEARMAALALELVQEGRLPLAGLPSSAGFAHSPISVYLYAPAFLFDSNPLTATIYSGLVGVVAVVLCWWLARRWAGSGAWGPGVAALLLAVSPWLVVFNRKVWQIAFVPALALAFVGLVISSLVEGRRWHLAWALVAYVLLVQVHPSAAVLAPALFLWLVVFRRQVKAGPLALGAVLAMTTTIPFLIYQIRQGWPLLAALQAMPQAVTDLEAVRLAGKAISGSDIYALAGEAYPLLEIVPRLAQSFHLSAWLVVGGLAILAWRTCRDWRTPDAERSRAARVDLVLISWLVVPVLFNLQHGLDLHLHSFALIVPAAYLVIGRAADALAQRGGQRMASLRTLGIMGLVAVGCLAACQVVALVLMARFVANNDTPGGFDRPLGQYLAVADQVVETLDESDALEVLIVGQGDSPETDPFPAIFDTVLRGRASLRFVDSRSTAVFPSHPAIALIAPHADDNATLYGSWPSEELADGFRLIHLDGSWPAEGFLPFQGPRTFENGVELQGYRWQGRAAPGGEVSLWLLWQVLWSNSEDTHFFVHLLDAENQRIGQQDGEGYPTPQRRKGDRILSKFQINVPQQAGNGPYSARVGLYRYPEIVNLSILDEAGNPVAETVVVDLVMEGFLEQNGLPIPRFCVRIDCHDLAQQTRAWASSGRPGECPGNIKEKEKGGKDVDPGPLCQTVIRSPSLFSPF